MIVRCPECQTGFNLSPEKVPAKGAKLRCSKCEHLFRVRITDGRPEIFYKKTDEPLPKPKSDPLEDLDPFGDADDLFATSNNETQMGGLLHRSIVFEQKRETELLEGILESKSELTFDKTSFGAPSSGTQPRRKGVVPSIPPESLVPIESIPRVEHRKPVSPLVTDRAPRKLNAISSDELDLFADDSGFGFSNSNNDNSVEDPFYGAFDESDEEPNQQQKAAVDLHVPVEPYEFSGFDLPEPIPMPQESVFENKVEESSSEDFFMRGGSSRVYDSPEETLLEPTPPASRSQFPEPAPDLIPDENLREERKEKAKEKKRKKRIKKSLVPDEPKLELDFPKEVVQKPHARPVQTLPSQAKASLSDSQKFEKEKRRHALNNPSPGPIALQPQKVGGSAIRRIFDTLFIAIFLVGLYIAVIAYKTGGFFDFSAPLEMIEVAFEGKPYEKTSNAKKDKDSNLQRYAKPYLKQMIATPLRIKSKDHVLLINGLIENPGPDATNREIIVKISSSAGETEKTVHLGEALSIAQLKEGLEADSFSSLPKINQLAKDSTTPFFVVFRSPVRFRDLEMKAEILTK